MGKIISMVLFCAAVCGATRAQDAASLHVGAVRVNVTPSPDADLPMSGYAGRTAEGAHWLGQNPEGPSDKTVHVVRFDRLDGQPIAILANYAVHGVVGGQGNLLITADLPGATSRYVERHYGDEVVVAWTSGAAGDQNPIYAVLDDLDSGRIRPLELQGRLLGEEVIRVADDIRRTTPSAAIYAAQKVIRGAEGRQSSGQASE